MYPLNETELYLTHHGIKGMKWGIRKSRQNPDYKTNQRKRDQQVYGKRGMRRINKAMNKGDSVSVARGAEKTRRDNVIAKNKYARQGGNIAGAAAGFVATNVGLSAIAKAAFSQKTTRVLGTLFKNAPFSVQKKVWAASVVAKQVTSTLNDPIIKTVISASMAKVGSMAAGDLAVSARMRARGYDPNRKY